ncbi:MAG TPA: hypothetical protein VLH85_00620 [Levilinea sp.]|nr:hypothetical protein [Levilinea sp.]
MVSFDHLQAGKLVTEEVLAAFLVRAAVLRLLADENARRKAKELQAAYQDWDGPANAAHFLEEHFGAGKHPAGYAPLQNLAGERVDLRRWLLALLLLSAVLVWKLSHKDRKD